MRRLKLAFPLRTTLLYLLFGSLWILLSDQVLSFFLLHDPQQTLFQTFKGWFFILVSGVLLYFLLRRDFARGRQAEKEMAWLASFPALNPNPVVEIDSTGAVFYMNPAAQQKFPELKTQGFNHPWLAGLDLVIERCQREGIHESQREIQVGDTWYSQPAYYVRERARLRVYGSDITKSKHAELEASQMKRLYATLSQVNQVIVRVKEENELYQGICDVSVQFGEFVLAWVGLLDESTGNVRPVAANGLDVDAWPFNLVNIHAGPVVNGLIARTIRDSQVVVSDDMQNDETMQSVHEMFERYGYRSSAGVPFRLRGRTVGVLNLISSEAGFFQSQTEIHLLEEMGLDISFALDTMAGEHERRQAEAEISSLAKFPSENPNPVLRIACDGTLLYANPSSAHLLQFCTCTVGSKLPDHIREISSEVLRLSMQKEVEIDFNGQIFSMIFAPIAEAGYVNVYGRNITDRKLTQDEIESRSRQLAALLEASQSLTESLQVADVLQRITDKSAEVLGIDATAIYLVNGENLHLGAATPSLPAEFPEAFRKTILVDHPHIAEALATRQPVILRDATSAVLTGAERTVSEGLGLRTVLYIPLAGRKEAVGVLILGTQGKTREFSRNELDLARTFSNQAALAISNAKLYEDQAGHVKELENQVAERKRAEEQFHLVVESAPNAILLVDRDGRLRLVNDQVENYFGYDRAELIGMDLDQLIPGRFRHGHSAQFADFMAAPQPRALGMGRDLYCLRKDGTEFPAEIGLTPLKSQEEPLVMVTIVDITVRKQTEERLQRQVKRLNALRMIDIAISSSFNQSLILDVVLQQVHSQLGVDASTFLLFDNYLQRIEFATSRGFRSNPIPQNLSKPWEGYARQVVLERKTLHFSSTTEPDQKLATPLHLKSEAFIDYYGTPLIIKGEVKGVLEIYNRSILHPDHEWLDFLETLAGQAAIAIDNAQMFAGLQRVNTELEQRVVERTAELHRINAELERANRAKDEFLANMSHELRTPLTGILGLSESLLEERRGSLNDYQQRSLQIIETSGQHLLELINDILDLSKVEAGKFDFYPQSVMVNELCKASLTFIKSQAAKKSIRIDFDNQAQVSEIFADARRLKQILVNLLSNAVKFTPKHGTVTLQVTTRLEQDLIQFSVIDTGIGIAAEELCQVFQPFVQVDSSLNRQHEGTGLGLALAQKLTDLHGGSIQVASEAGKGSRFTINLNCRQDILAQSKGTGLTAQFAEIGPAEQLTVSPAVPARRGRILLAEDNLPNILTIGEYLESNGYEVVVAHDGLEAITKAEETQPDLILMDIQMPVMNGLEAIAHLRAEERFGSTPIIALTALAMPGDREHCLQVGANEYMSKPVSLKNLVQTIHRLTGHQGQNRDETIRSVSR